MSEPKRSADREAQRDASHDIAAVRDYLTGLQTRIADTLGAFDGTPFATDAWTREPGVHLRGGGVTRILEGGGFFERAGIGFSDVAGDALPPSASAARPQLAGAASRRSASRSSCIHATRTARPCT